MKKTNLINYLDKCGLKYTDFIKFLIKERCTISKDDNGEIIYWIEDILDYLSEEILTMKHIIDDGVKW